MSPSTSAPHRSTRPSLHCTPTTVVIISVVVLVLSPYLPITTARTLHYHRKHRSHHRPHHHAMNGTGSHISQPPTALPPDVSDSPVESRSLPPDVDNQPPTLSRHDKPCAPSHPPSKALSSSLSPVGMPMPRSPARGTYFSPAKPPLPSPAITPSPSYAKPPFISPAGPPSLSPAKPPLLSPAKPPPLLPYAKTPSLSPAKPQTLSPAPEPSASQAKKRPSFPTSPRPQPPARPPSLYPVSKPPFFSPARPPSLPSSKSPQISPAKPPSSFPHAKPPSLSPAKSPALSPAMPNANPPSLHPEKPPSLSPAYPPSSHSKKQPPPPPKPLPHPPAKPPSLYPVAKPPSPSPGTKKAMPPSLILPAKPPSLYPAGPAAKNNSTPCVFDVREFGAVGNGSSDDTRAFRAAWKAACSAESAVMLVPSDGVFMVTSTIFSGPCLPGLTFQIDGVLMPPDGPASWPEADSRRQWIVFYRTDGMTLTGKGTIEGNGEEWWNLPCKPHRGPNGSTLSGPCDSPALIRFFLCNNVTVKGLRIENSPQFHIKFDGCEQVRINGLSVGSPASSPNTDGVHVENTKFVEIYNSRISNGDDCISIGAGCSHVHVENVTCSSGHGISIGSLGVHNSRACVSNITVRSSRIRNSDNGVRIKTWQGGTGTVSAVRFAGVQMENVKNCIVIDQYYCLGKDCANQTAAVYVTGVAYSDIRGTYNPQAAAPIRFACSDSLACTDITMTDVELLPFGGGPEALLADPYCWNAYGVMQTLTLPPVYCLQEGRPQSLQDLLTANCSTD